MKTDYDAIANTYDRRYEVERYDDTEQALFRFVESARSVLEVGCGTGHWLAKLRERGLSVSGLDASEQMLAWAREKVPSADIALGTAERLPWPDASFDRVFSINAIHHFPDGAGFVREAMRVLRVGGQLFSSSLDPSTGIDRWAVYDYWERTRAIDLERFPPAERIRHWMADAGFSEVRTEVAQRVDLRVDAREAIDTGRVAKSSTSELALLGDEEYAAGLARIEADIAAAAARGERLELIADLRMYATIGVKTRKD